MSREQQVTMSYCEFCGEAVRAARHSLAVCRATLVRQRDEARTQTETWQARNTSNCSRADHLKLRFEAAEAQVEALTLVVQTLQENAQAMTTGIEECWQRLGHLNDHNEMNKESP